MKMMNTLYEMEEQAQLLLTPMANSYYSSGARDELTLRANREAWDQIWLHYRVLVDVENRSTVTTIMGQQVSSPVMIAPSAFHGLAHPEGELATARGAAQAGCIYVSSTLSNRSIEEIAQASTGPRWFQLYVYRNRDITLDLISRAEQSGCSALVITVDAAMIGTRERDRTLKFRLPDGMTMGNFSGLPQAELVSSEQDSALANYVQSQLDPSLTWSDLTWLISQTKLPVLVKGIVRPDDALKAMKAGAKGVIVSNHGGRQLDTAPPTAIVLPKIAQALNGEGQLFVDGGIRRGTDIVKAIALGAQGVLIGRPVLWGLTCGGAEGVERVLDILNKELLEVMALCGCPTIASIDRDLISI